MFGGRLLFEQPPDVLVRWLSPSNGLGPRILRSLKAACSSRMKRATTVYTVVREQKRTRAISVGDRPSAQSSMMCILERFAT